MKQASTIRVASANVAENAQADRSAEVAQLLNKQPRDHLTCVRVYGDFYRCNWWAPGDVANRPGAIEWLEISTYRVRKSQFVKATMNDGKLAVEDATFGHE